MLLAFPLIVLVGRRGLDFWFALQLGGIDINLILAIAIPTSTGATRVRYAAAPRARVMPYVDAGARRATPALRITSSATWFRT